MKKILVLINNPDIRLGLWREFEGEAELIHADRFSDIIAEIKWSELDCVVIDTDGEEIDSFGIIQMINTVCPSVPVLLLSITGDESIREIADFLMNGTMVSGTRSSQKIAQFVRQILNMPDGRGEPDTDSQKIEATSLQTAYGKGIEKLTGSLMELHEYAGDFQLGKQTPTWESLSQMESLSEELRQLTKKFRNQERRNGE